LKWFEENIVDGIPACFCINSSKGGVIE